jgi:fructose-1,6-bisphosphatase I
MVRVEMTASSQAVELQSFLNQTAAQDQGLSAACAAIAEMALAAAEMADLIALGRLYGSIGASTDHKNTDGDVQKQLDIIADEKFIAALRRAPVAIVVSEELNDPLVLNEGAPVVVAIDPLDGSSNIDANVSIGTIFSILPAIPGASDTTAHFLQPGRMQLAAGFAVYGPQTSLVLAIAGKTQIFTFDRRIGKFIRTSADVQIKEDATEYAINASNYRHWDPSVRIFIDDCVQGVDGPFGRNYNMRWIASLVAEAYRILLRGGLFLYPGDHREGYADGRLRLTYEANPMALVAENAGGAATDGHRRILDIVPAGIHVRSPLIFGSVWLVDLVSRFYADPHFSPERAPLFAQRGLMRG